MSLLPSRPHPPARPSTRLPRVTAQLATLVVLALVTAPLVGPVVDAFAGTSAPPAALVLTVADWLAPTAGAQEGGGPGTGGEEESEDGEDGDDGTDGGEEGGQDAAAATGPDTPVVLRIRIESAIHPVVTEFIEDAVAEAESRRAEVLIIELSTPGGLVTSTREICSALLGTPVPVVVWVAPAGTHAASAGFFILMASDLAVMAPSTNTGAAATVSGSGEEMEETLKAKAQEDGAAYIRTLAGRKGRNVDLAEAAVLEARSFTAEEALEQGLVELIVPSLPTLLMELDGMELEKNGATRTLRTAEATVETFEMSFLRTILAFLAQPTVAYLLMSVGWLGIYFELMNPGGIFPGVIGAICLVLALFGLSVLPVNYAGVALVGLALAFFIAEIKVPSFGLLTAAGVVSLLLGSLMLFKDAGPALRVSTGVIAAVVGSMTVAALFLLGLATRAFRSRVTTGLEGMVTERGVAKTALDPRGKVWVHGELWTAESPEPVAEGEEVEVTEVRGMLLRVRPVADSISGASGASTVEA